MFKGLQGRSLAGNAVAAVYPVTAALTAHVSWPKCKSVPMKIKTRKKIIEIPSADKVMKIHINHPQCTLTLPVKLSLEISTHLRGVRQQKIGTSMIHDSL